MRERGSLSERERGGAREREREREREIWFWDVSTVDVAGLAELEVALVEIAYVRINPIMRYTDLT